MNVLLSNYNFHEDWIWEELKDHINADSKVVVLPFTFSEEWISNSEQWYNSYSKEKGKYYSEVVEPFLTFGVNEENIIWLNYFEHGSEEMIKYINNSDILFFTGGLPEKSVERILELGLLDTLKKFKKLMIGASAGAMVQLQDFYVSPDDDYEFFKYYKGLGLLESGFYIEVHYTGSDVQEECINKVLNEKTDKIYAIGEKGGIIIEDGLLKTYGEVHVFDKA